MMRSIVTSEAQMLKVAAEKTEKYLIFSYGKMPRLKLFRSKTVFALEMS